MAILRTDYTDAVWSGNKKYLLIENDDGTISLQDVTAYTNKENSFFGASDANSIKEADTQVKARQQKTMICG